MNVLDRRDKTDFFFLLNSIAAKIQQLVVQFLFQTVILLDALTALVRVVNLNLSVRKSCWQSALSMRRYLHKYWRLYVTMRML